MKPQFINFIPLVLSILFSLIIIEIVLTILDYPPARIVKYDACCGVALSPNTEGLFKGESEQYIVINSHGLRDIEHTYNKPSNTYRIAILGDSFSEARQVSIEQTFWKYIESELTKCESFSDKNIEVINFGVSGYGTDQEYETLRYKVWKYDPDMVITAFFTGNDIRNNVMELEGDINKPYYIFQSSNNKHMMLDDSFKERKIFKFMTSSAGNTINWLLKNFYIIRLLNNIRKSGIDSIIVNSSDVDLNKNIVGELGLANEIYKKPINMQWENAWNITEQLIKKTKKEVERHGAEYFLVTLSTGIQVHPDISKKKKFSNKIAVGDLFYPDYRLSEFSSINDINHIMTAPYLSRWSQDNQICLHGFDNSYICEGHWNEVGHKVAGKYISSKICQLSNNKTSELLY